MPADSPPSEAIAGFEPNNSIDAADSIEFDRGVDGNLSSMSDVDYYKFSVDQRVKLSIAFSSEKSTGTGWNYELLAEDGSVLGASDCNQSSCVSGEV